MRNAECGIIVIQMQRLKQLLKRVIGRGVLSAGRMLPWSRTWLGSLGLRTSQGLFGQRIVAVPLEDGKTLRLTHIDESYLAFELFWRGCQYYEPITRALLARLLHPADTFIDIGAHLGFFALTTAIRQPQVKIIAFEPNPKNFRILQANVAANHLTTLICEPLAISDRSGMTSLYLTESDMSASLMKDFQAEDTRQIDRIEVPVVSLDDYVGQHSVQGRLVIKVDIEGHEAAFFRGADQTIASFKPDIILEVLYDQEPAIVSRLKSLGYRFYPITDEGLMELEAPKLIKRFPFLFLNHLLSVRPREELELIFGDVNEATRSINLLQTSKHFPKEQWPALWGSSE